jgi:hypothetical protein
MIWLALQILGALAGFAILVVLLGATVIALARKRLKAAHYCEFCWKTPAAYLANWDSDSAPIGICEPCRKQKMGPLLTEQWIENGKLVELGERV